LPLSGKIFDDAQAVAIKQGTTKIKPLMINHYDVDGTHCFRALLKALAVYQSDAGKLIARAEKPNRSAM